jgi:DNA repair protein
LNSIELTQQSLALSLFFMHSEFLSTLFSLLNLFMSSSTSAPPHAAAAAAAASAATPATSAQHSSSALDYEDEYDIDELIDLEQSMLAEEQAASEEASVDASGGGFEISEGGGFLSEDVGRATSASSDPSIGVNGIVTSLEEDAPSRTFASGCRECGSIGVQQNFLTAFNVSVCFRCQRAHPHRYALVTQTSCLQTYLLPLQMIQSRLGFIEKNNPHKQAWGSMKLYWKQQVLALVREKYGSVQALEEAKHVREVARIAKDDARRRTLHRSAAREAAFHSTVAASMSQLDTQTPSEVVAMLAKRTKGMGAAANSRSADKRKRMSKKNESIDVNTINELDEHDPFEGMSNNGKKRAKKAEAARIQQTKQLHTHSFNEEAGRRICTLCRFVEEFEEF